ncbi:hypothetical protein [Streptomyces sp. NPDC059761]|uniref:hypothetical protein n=1 Tax=Streptomyces sp. NPDC059761 TaxID=3346937 RepID=UPI003654AFA7
MTKIASRRSARNGGPLGKATASLAALVAAGAAVALAAGPASAAATPWEKVNTPKEGDRTLRDYVPLQGDTGVGMTEAGRSGEGEKYHYWLRDGKNWKQLPTVSDHAWSRANALTGTSANDVWVMEEIYQKPVLVNHWNGSAWENRSPAEQGLQLRDAKPVKANDLWAVGQVRVAGAQANPAAVGHWDGKDWKVTKLPQAAGGSSSLSAVHVNSAADVWAVGNTCKDLDGKDCRPYVVKWDGASWQEVSTPVASGTIDKVVGRAANDLWVSGKDTAGAFALHWDGKSWTRADVKVPGIEKVGSLTYHNGQLHAGLNSAYYANKGAVVRWNGNDWEKLDNPVESFSNINRLTTAPDGSLWSVGATYVPFWEPTYQYFVGKLAAPAAR